METKLDERNLTIIKECEAAQSSSYRSSTIIIETQVLAQVTKEIEALMLTP